MQNTTNPNQQFYTKNSETFPKMSENSSANMNTDKTTPKKNKFKNIFAVAAFVILALGGAMGVLISQRQATTPGEDVKVVTPNAPTSQPQAAPVAEVQSCTMQFEVFPVIGDIKCLDKKLYDAQGEPMEAGSALTRGEEYEYVISLIATNLTPGKVILNDVIPAPLEFSRVAPENEVNIINDPSAGTIVANFGQLDNEEVSLRFFVTLPIDAEPMSNVENIAKVYTVEDLDADLTPPVNANQCSVTHTVLPEGIAQCDSKQAFTDFNGTQLDPESEINPGDEFVYRITVSAEKTTTGPVVINDVLPDDLKFIDDPENDPRIVENPENTLTIDLGGDTGDQPMIAGDEEIIEFKVQLASSPTEDVFENSATVITNEDTENPSVCSIPLNLKKYSCNSECTTDANCKTIGENYTCHETSNGDKFCRYIGNEDNLECKSPLCGDGVIQEGEACDDGNDVDTDDCRNDCTLPKCGDGVVQEGEACDDGNNVDTDSCKNNCTLPNCGDGILKSPEQCDDGNNISGDGCNANCNVENSTPTPTPAPGCNELCVQNADCSNTAHICVTTADGSNRCRLDKYVDSTTCTVPAQPTLPPQLPETGPADWMNWLKAGLATLGIGTALFLLL